MERFERRHELVKQVEYVSKFNRADDDLEAKYGLPRKVEFCTRCVISNQRPNSAIECRPDSSFLTIAKPESLPPVRNKNGCRSASTQ